MKTIFAMFALAIVASVLVYNEAMAQSSVTLGPLKDNTLFEDVTGSLSNGAGPNFFVGTTALDEIRRGVIAFDVAASVPPGMTIDSVKLTLNMSQTITGPHNVELRSILADWGEGTSNSTGGQGAPSTPGDATWIHRFFNTDFWTTTGGDFSNDISATQTVNTVGFYTWGSTAAMVADVQEWLDDPSNNFGWILIGEESTFPTSKRFDTKENATVANRPWLTVYYSDPNAIPCEDFTALLSNCVGGGTVRARVTLQNSTIHAGKTATFMIDTDAYTATVVTNGTHSRAQIIAPGYAAGTHTVSLSDPEGCLAPKVVTCAAGLATVEAAWNADDALWAPTSGQEKAAPTKLQGNYPNPFNPTTMIHYSLGSDTWVTLKVYNMLGQEVTTLVNELQTAGYKSVTWDGNNSVGEQVSAGVFVYTIRAGEFVQSNKMIILK